MNATNIPVKKRFDYTLMIVPFLVFTLIGATFLSGRRALPTRST